MRHITNGTIYYPGGFAPLDPREFSREMREHIEKRAKELAEAAERERLAEWRRAWRAAGEEAGR